MHVGMELDGLNVVEMPSLSSKYPQGLVILQDPEFGGPVGCAGNEVASERRELDVPNRIVMAIVNHQRPICLKAPSPDGVVIRPAQQMLITNGYGH